MLESDQRINKNLIYIFGSLSSPSIGILLQK